jgi:hypothetical protein
MATIDILIACVGMLICCTVFALVGVVIAGIIWWVFRTNMDIEIESEKWEEEK